MIAPALIALAVYALAVVALAHVRLRPHFAVVAHAFAALLSLVLLTVACGPPPTPASKGNVANGR